MVSLYDISAGYILDPHTAIAKCVADRLDQGHRPMLIAATAHYAKFAPTVLQAVGQSSGGDPKSLFDALERLKLKPAMHQSLKRCMQRERVHHDVCEPDIEVIMEQVKRYAGH